jgi:hypothetical protein
VIHIIGIDTPKLGQKAHCGLERVLAARAKVACSCRPGADGSTVCNDSRNCGEVKVDGEDAGDILITENLAHPYACGLHECPNLKPWCPFETE